MVLGQLSSHLKKKVGYLLHRLYPDLQIKKSHKKKPMNYQKINEEIIELQKLYHHRKVKRQRTDGIFCKS